MKITWNDDKDKNIIWPECVIRETLQDCMARINLHASFSDSFNVKVSTKNYHSLRTDIENAKIIKGFEPVNGVVTISILRISGEDILNDWNF